ncbi:MAG: KamA family radical SAM protein [Bacteriovoracia bacterium]
MNLDLQAEDQKNWQKELLNSYTTVEDLVQAGWIRLSDAKELKILATRFRIRIPRYYASLFGKATGKLQDCPIVRQAIPQVSESDPVLPGWAQNWSLLAFERKTPWTADAIGDVAKLEAPKITHRYENRAIFHVTSVCALYCRFCFRKEHINDSEKTLYDGSTQESLAYLKKHPEISELILTGGDPLSMNDTWVNRFFDNLSTVSSIRTVRIHTRMPVTLPHRMTHTLLETLQKKRQQHGIQINIVSHFNHPIELTDFAAAKIKKFIDGGIPFFNQSVLLHGVNDQSDLLAELFQKLYSLGASSFYLHHPDLTPGTFSFRTSIKEGQKIYSELAGKVSGPALPHYVLEMPFALGKTSLSQPLRVIDEKKADGFIGALYEFTVPHTRSRNTQKRALYFDLVKGENLHLLH